MRTRMSHTSTATKTGAPLRSVSRGSTSLPTLGTVFSEGDLLHLAVRATSTERLRALLGLG